MSDYTQIAYEIADGVALITLDRPERLNAFTDVMKEEVIAALDRVDADDDVRAVIFTGRGRAFCAGADLASGNDTFDYGGERFAMERHADGGGQMTLRMFECDKPLIAAINGPAVGIGATMTLPMDVRLAADGARIGFIFARRGLVCEAASSWFLPRLVGMSQALEWVTTARVFDAQEALRGGLVKAVHAGDQLLPAARALAGEIADGTSPIAVAVARRLLWRMAAAPSPYEAHRLDSEAIYELGRGADVREGVDAFLEKRPAQFPGRLATDAPAFYRRWRSAWGADDLARATAGEAPLEFSTNAAQATSAPAAQRI
jgi:enoyl-CoA hydratase/carnithine racemase